MNFLRSNFAPKMGLAVAVTPPDATVRELKADDGAPVGGTGANLTANVGCGAGLYTLVSDTDCYVAQVPSATAAVINAGAPATQAWLNANGTYCPAGVECGPFELALDESLLYASKTGAVGTDFRVNKRSR